MKLEEGSYLVKKEDFEQFVKDADEGGVKDSKGKLYSEFVNDRIKGYPYHEYDSRSEVVIHYGCAIMGFGWDCISNSDRDYKIYTPCTSKQTVEVEKSLTFDEVSKDCREYGTIISQDIRNYSSKIWLESFGEHQTRDQFLNQMVFCKAIILKYLEVVYEKESKEKLELKKKIDDLEEVLDKLRKNMRG